MNTDKLLGYLIILLNLLMIFFILSLRGNLYELEKNTINMEVNLLNSIDQYAPYEQPLDKVWSEGIWIVQFNNITNQFETIVNPNPSLWDRISYMVKI